MQRTISFILIIVSLIILTATCGKTKQADTKATPIQKELFIGLIPEQNIFKQLDRYEPITEYLSSKINFRIKLKILPKYGDIIHNFVSLGLDGAFFGSFTYVLAHSKLGVEVVARPAGGDGSFSYYGMIFARKDSGITNSTSMKGKTFAFVDKATTAGYLFPIRYFKDNGIKDYHTYLKEVYFTGTHEDAILDVLNGKSDMGAAKNTIFDRMAGKDKRVIDELFILARSPDVPETALALRKGLEGSIKTKLARAILTMHEDPGGAAILEAFGAKRFTETTDKDYEAVYRYCREIELDLATYDYMNE